MIVQVTYIDDDMHNAKRVSLDPSNHKLVRNEARKLRSSPQAGLNHRPFAYEASALPLSYRGRCQKLIAELDQKHTKLSTPKRRELLFGRATSGSRIYIGDRKTEELNKCYFI